MRPHSLRFPFSLLSSRTVVTVAAAVIFTASGWVQEVCAQTTATQLTYKPYIQPGDSGSFAETDQMIVAWQTNETAPNAPNYRVEYGESPNCARSVLPSSRIVNNYLKADDSLPVPPTAPGPLTDYEVVLKPLEYDTTYYYKVTGPGLPPEGFQSQFRTRTKSGKYSFLVMGDEGYFPASADLTVTNRYDYFARIVHLMYNAGSLNLPGFDRHPRPNFALNTGDNVYNTGSEDSYRDFWMPVWNSDVDSVAFGAPFIRSIPNYIVTGNHDIGGGGDFVNLLGDDSAPRFAGQTGGGNALAYFNNYYFPLNGPPGVDPQYVFNRDQATPTGFFFKYQGQSYDSPTAIQAFRQSTLVNSGRGSKMQIDHMSNYSFDYGNAHFTFLDANPHLFNALLPPNPNYQLPLPNFPQYPSILRHWVINDLDSSKQLWKVVIFHQPAFSSGNATLKNSQMRRIAKILEDHGVSLVFNGHEHNYQRTFPIRASSRAGDEPAPSNVPAVQIDSIFDGAKNVVPDGVLYFVEGAGGNRDFDNDEVSPRGSGVGVDQDDSAVGTFTYDPGLTFPNGPASWLDTNLTNVQMTEVFPGSSPTPGSGPKITKVFKAKVFSFADVVVNRNQLTLYQISEPLTNSSSATANNPAPFGLDYQAKPLNDPVPDTLVDPKTGEVVSPIVDGQPALLDKVKIVKPEVEDQCIRILLAPLFNDGTKQITYRLILLNNSAYALNGTQAELELPKELAYDGPVDDQHTVQSGYRVVLTVGRLEPGQKTVLTIPTRMAEASKPLTVLETRAEIRSGTAEPFKTNEAATVVFTE